tara:strand:- start:284 stop:514 length:231 start_codon:yes stop_codon:yes gene_type:complete
MIYKIIDRECHSNSIKDVPEKYLTLTPEVSVLLLINSLETESSLKESMLELNILDPVNAEQLLLKEFKYIFKLILG